MTTRDLMKMGARVIMACRSPTKGEDVSVYLLLGYSKTSHTSDSVSHYISVFLLTYKIGNIGNKDFLKIF